MKSEWIACILNNILIYKAFYKKLKIIKNFLNFFLFLLSKGYMKKNSFILISSHIKSQILKSPCLKTKARAFFCPQDPGPYALEKTSRSSLWKVKPNWYLSFHSHSKTDHQHLKQSPYRLLQHTALHAENKVRYILKKAS